MANVLVANRSQLEQDQTGDPGMYLGSRYVVGGHLAASLLPLRLLWLVEGLQNHFWAR